MKKAEQTPVVYARTQSGTGTARPLEPASGRAPSGMERRRMDPSSVMRSERYPVPSFEYRVRS